MERAAGAMVLNRDQEVWGMALWVEKHHTNGHAYIDNRISELQAAGETEGVMIWRRVRDCYQQLKTGPIPIYGQPETWPN